MKNLYLIFILSFILVLSCKNADNKSIHFSADDQLFEFLDSIRTGITFQNTITESENLNFLLYEYLHNGAGVSIGDINNDGLPDVYFNGNMVYNKLYLNMGDFRFKDITEDAGVDGGMGFKTGVTMVDINADGWLDIYICKSALADPALRRNILYINNQDMTFTEMSADYGLDDAGFSTQAYFFDMDGDKDLDLYLLNHPGNMLESNNINVVQDPTGKLVLAKPDDYTYISDRLYRNNGKTFEDITASTGLLNEAFSLSAVIGDFNNDLLSDIYVCNDYAMPDYLYINKGNGKFHERFDDHFQHTSFSSMGSDFADINNDGCLDLMTLDMLPRDNYRQKMLGMAQNFDKYQKMLDLNLKAQFSANTLQLNSCTGTFSDIAFLSGVAMTDWSWSTLLADFDNDGLKDIFVSNGYVRDVTNNDYARYTMDSLQKLLNAGNLSLLDWLDAIPTNKISSYLFKGTNGIVFSDYSTQWGSGGPAFSSGTAYADLNNDGFLDMIVSNINESPFIMVNKGKKMFNNNFLRVKLRESENRTLHGTLVHLYVNDSLIVTEYFNPTKGFLSSSEPVLHFGLGTNTTLSKLEIIWPDKTVQVIQNPDVNNTLEIAKKVGTPYKRQQNDRPFFRDITKDVLQGLIHKENLYIDFKREPLLHHKYSENGPAAAVSDVNGDGIDDIFMGGAMNHESLLYFGTKQGTFIKSSQPDFNTDKEFEDVAASFLDVNMDGYPDLYVVSGGNERDNNSPYYQDRLYLNDGNGRFFRDKDALPTIYSSGACIAVNDVDSDGDPDIFIGGRVTPGRYPEAPESFLLINENGKFTDATAQLSEGLSKVGMVTNAVFSDLDNDGIAELVISGEWMPIKVFKNSNGKFKDFSEQFGLAELSGWWYGLAVSDINKDGYLDILAGNLGLNSFIKASGEHPASIYYDDFDKNGSVDAILTFYNTEKNYPLHFRDRLQDQMIVLKKNFTRYHPYALAGIDDILTREQMKKAETLTTTIFEHSIFINKQGKHFERYAMPVESQISVINSFYTHDFDGNGYMDILYGGNFYGTDAQIGRYDASIGGVLMGKDNDEFRFVPSRSSGLKIPGNVCHIIPVNLGSGKHVLWIVRNNESASFIEILKDWQF